MNYKRGYAEGLNVLQTSSAALVQTMTATLRAMIGNKKLAQDVRDFLQGELDALTGKEATNDDTHDN